jgi:carboxylate-amine ligase
MPVPVPEFTVGIEEEYLLVDRQSRNLVSDPPGTIMEECVKRLGIRVAPEFMRTQIEIGTRPSTTIPEARRELRELRSTVAEVADKEGLAIIASSTHPFGSWRDQLPTDKERYEALAQDMAAVLKHLLIGGMHVHAGISDDDLRIDLMNQVTYFIPHLLALSTSSPFFDGYDTGMQSYRKSIFKAMPRTGLPPQIFSTWSEYRRHVNALVGPGIIEDATKIWWEIRPSDRYPTLEFRASDVCPYIEDSLTVASLYLALLRMLWRRRTVNQRWRIYANFLIEENLWRAQRYPLAELTLIDFGQSETKPYPVLVEELLELIAEDAEALGVVDEVQRARRIIEVGTSADRQRRVYAEAVSKGADNHGALVAVVDHLIDETTRGL